MKSLAQLDLYEVLEVPRSASPAEIERAYRLALETWGEDSMAAYPVVPEVEAAALRERAQAAYRVLADDRSRRAYDASTAAEPACEPAALPPPALPDSRHEPFEEEEDEGSEWSGARLRRVRLRRGLELEEVASVTKINPTYLHCIEEECYPELPPRVYLRGFVAAFATCIGLEGSRVAAGYLDRYERARGDAGRRRRSW